jgi:superfamily II DNA or RNA helicase
MWSSARIDWFPKTSPSRDLGLLVIDEEQKFGVKVKERLKHIRAEVDVLTLTATPIPRTLAHVTPRHPRHQQSDDSAARSDAD